MPTMTNEGQISNEGTGTVIAVRGPVIDVQIDAGPLPAINDSLIIEWDRPEALVVEVLAHLDQRRVRGVALQGTSGLQRGVRVRSGSGPITVPVGDAVLGRLLDVIGSTRDNGPALPPETARAPIHRAPPALAERTAATAIFETGIKIIDLLAPLAHGGKAAMFGGAGVGKTVVIMGAHPCHGHELPRHIGVRRGWRTVT